MNTPATTQINALQWLRALAAGMVVFAHAQGDAMVHAARTASRFTPLPAFPFEAGVDLFFVISGFVMVYASKGLFGQSGAGVAFFSRRLTRIVPLYWIATALFAALALRGAAIPHPTLSEILASFGFVPFPRGLDGAPRPVHDLGWTLNYEMYFYAIFALFIAWPRGRAVALVTACLAGSVALGLLWPTHSVALTYWCDPIVLEFAAGMGIALLFVSGTRISGLVSLAAMVLAIIFLGMDVMGLANEPPGTVTPNGFARLLSWGVPMALVVAAIVLRKTPVQSEGTIGNALTRMGDASYALYLFHPLAIIVLRKAWLAANLQQTLGFWPMIVLSVAAAIGLSLAIHRLIEKPLTRWLQSRLHAQKPVNATPSAAR